MKTLILEKRGCPFFTDDPFREGASDIGNYRVGVYDYSIKGKDGRNYIVEFGFANGIRYTNKKTGKQLKHPVKDKEYEKFLHIDTQYENETGCYRNLELESKIYNAHYTYCKSDILKIVNLICGEEIYDNIEFAN